VLKAEFGLERCARNWALIAATAALTGRAANARRYGRGCRGMQPPAAGRSIAV